MNGGDETIVVTPTLVVGDRPTENFLSTPVASPQEAIAVIAAGGTARLPADHWLAASDVLRHFGLSEAEVLDRIFFSLTGRILPTT